jgi:peptidylprolyl isomerase
MHLIAKTPKYLNLLVILATVSLVSLASSYSWAYKFEDIIKFEEVGEAFGQPVSRNNFLHYYKTALLFTRSGAKEARTEEETRQEAWQNLVFIKEAKDIGIQVPKEEVVAEVKRLLAEKNVEYGTDKYSRWVIDSFNEDPATFEKRIEDLLTINKLLKVKLDPPVNVTEQEMKDKFLNGYNSFESEYILFGKDQQKEAQDFVRKVKKNPKLWFDTFQEKKSLGQKGASWVNIMSLEALIDLWQIPRDDAYRILDSQPGDFIAAKNYYGDVALRLLYAKKADLKEYNKDKQEYYRKMLTSGRKHKIAQDYLDDLFKRANLKDFVKEKEDAVKLEQMKAKSEIVLSTNQGDIQVRLFPDLAPLACENFIGLVEKGYYDGIIFHRVIKDFMIQGGDPTATGAAGESIWKKPFSDEFSEKVKFDKPGVLAMANSGSNTNGSQFFITVKPSPGLDGRYTIFGEVISGMEIVNKINSVATAKNDKPIEMQKIIKAYIKGAGQEKVTKKK